MTRHKSIASDPKAVLIFMLGYFYSRVFIFIIGYFNTEDILDLARLSPTHCVYCN